MSACCWEAMIEFMVNKQGTLTLIQRCESPMIYLDHWAVRNFSENQELATRLTAALKLRNGTLAVSWLNLVEFTKVKIEEQARKAEDLVEANLPRIFFLEVEPFAVIQREDNLLAGGPPAPPHADVEFLKVFSQFKPTSLNLFTANDLFRVVQASGLEKRFNDLANTFVGRIEAMRNNTDRNPEFQSVIRRLPSGPQIQRGTRFILRELVRTFLVDKRVTVTGNQAIDLLHAVVPLAYCDFVLLDKHWETQVNRIRSRFDAAGMVIPIGRVFSGKANGIERFLCELELS